MENKTFNSDYVARLGRHWYKPENAGRPEYLETIAANAAAIPFEIESLGDLAYRACASYSQLPEIGQLLREIGYTEHIAKFCKEITAARNDAAALDELRRYYEGYRAKVLAHLSALSRCMSAYIAGPANFPVQRAGKSKRRRTQAHGRTYRMAGARATCRQAQSRLASSLGCHHFRRSGGAGKAPQETG